MYTIIGLYLFKQAQINYVVNMTEQTFDNTFLSQFTETANRLPDGAAKDKMLRQAKRMDIMQQTGQEWYEVMLDEDRLPSAFDSNGLYETIQMLDIDQQKRLQRGIFWCNAFDGYDPVLVGSFAKVHFTNAALLITVPTMEYVMPFKYDRFLEFALSEENKAKGFTPIVSTDGTSFEIPSHGCRIYRTKANPAIEDIMSTAKLVKIYGGKVLASPDEQMWSID